MSAKSLYDQVLRKEIDYNRALKCLAEQVRKKIEELQISPSNPNRISKSVSLPEVHDCAKLASAMLTIVSVERKRTWRQPDDDVRRLAAEFKKFSKALKHVCERMRGELDYLPPGYVKGLWITELDRVEKCERELSERIQDWTGPRPDRLAIEFLAEAARSMWDQPRAYWGQTDTPNQPSEGRGPRALSADGPFCQLIAWALNDVGRSENPETISAVLRGRRRTRKF